MIDKFKGIILKLADYKETDKLATIFSLEYGIINAKFTGVKNNNAKFKAVAQPFVFANFVVAQKGSALTITQTDVLDEFPNLLQNYNKTICAYVVVDIVRSVLPMQKPEEDIFLLTLNSLKNIETQNEYLALINYILNFLKFSGVQLQFVNSKLVYLDTFSGNFVSTKTENALLIDGKVYSILQQANNSLTLSANAPTTPPTEKAVKQALHLLHNVIYLKLGADVKSFEFI